VITLHALSHDEVTTVVMHSMKDTEKGLGTLGLQLAPDALSYLVEISEGDARVALNGLEIAASLFASQGVAPTGRKTGEITRYELELAFQKKALIHDKHGEAHYNLISAFHKCLRGSDPDAALYWLSRMISAGENPLYIARRMVRFASEDVGNADPHALGVALGAMEAFRFLGSPEGELALAQAAVYLATALKSNSIYTGYNRALDEVQTTGNLPVPLHIRNAPTRLMKTLGYGKNYKYAHDYEEEVVFQEYLPDELKGRHYYFPADRGYEKIIKQRLETWRGLMKNAAFHKK
jgi:putative ATPase